MRVLLDHCVPAPLWRPLAAAGHDVSTCVREGWDTLRNGVLLREAQATFDVLLTIDQRLPDQQSLTGIDIAVVVMTAPPNRLADLLALVPDVLAVLPTLSPGLSAQIGPASGLRPAPAPRARPGTP